MKRKASTRFRVDNYITLKEALAYAGDLEHALDEIRAALFPGPRKTKGGLMVDADAYYNLEGALIDMRRTRKADKVCINTIARVQRQIAKVHKALEKASER